MLHVVTVLLEYLTDCSIRVSGFFWGGRGDPSLVTLHFCDYLLVGECSIRISHEVMITLLLHFYVSSVYKKVSPSEFYIILQV